MPELVQPPENFQFFRQSQIQIMFPRHAPEYVEHVGPPQSAERHAAGSEKILENEPRRSNLEPAAPLCFLNPFSFPTHRCARSLCHDPAAAHDEFHRLGKKSEELPFFRSRQSIPSFPRFKSLHKRDTHAITAAVRISIMAKR
jgi:hypothetical protein